ncbi:LysR family transcriptional regulator [Rhizobium fabae]|uniref:HTH-type transcriptional regulator TtuA n=1 Tax=Rhizobium fabae TaxID=573179 RepID=A0A7W6FGI7_9HYPH|nr:LysR family transcriptional regulator [Rhizobium fabae]MBB3912830.1 DNA-binding transcriptional LysR family regulator [Rhizobium fabae]RUM15130.1 LysR family transcriptional regulator [Rhizobium fabae]
MPDLLNLQTLIAAATSGSFAGAAKRLGISPAMVGRRIQALEQEYGVKLIERTTRTQRLTEIGSRFLVKASRIIDELEELNDISRPDAEALSGRLRVSAPTTLGIKRLAPAMAELAERHPALSVELNLSDRNVDLVAEGYDLAIRIGELKPSSLIARRVGSYHFVCCASPAYFERFAAPERPEDLRLGRCILNLNLVPRDEWPFETEDGESFTVAVRGNIEIDNGEALRTAALAGAGIIYIPVDLVAEDIADGRLVEVLSGWRKLVLPIHAVHPSRRFVPGRIGAVIDAIARGLRG